MKFFSTILLLFFFEFAMGQIPGTPNLSSQLQKPSVYTLSYTFPNLTTANITGQVIFRKNRIDECGILWGGSIPTIENYLGKTTDGLTNSKPFTSTATSLPFDVDTIYFVAYATTKDGKTQYGKVLTLPRTVQSPYTGKVWMASNLGATTTPVYPSPTPDVSSYGNLYQWGRTSDGHEIAQPTKSAETTTLAANYTNTTSSFITNSSGTQDWLTSENPNLWQGTTGLNNPCPTGYRVPSLTEFSDEIIYFSSQNISGAFNSFLKLPVTGSRDNAGNVIGYASHDIGRYWTSTINGSYSSPIYLTATSITQPTDLISSARVNGFAIRCIRGEISSGGSAIVTAYTLGTSAGTMTASVPVSAVTQTISATVSKTGNYNIAAIANGVKFSAKGIFLETGEQNIVLTASGTPELGTPPGSSISYTLNTLPNTTFTRTVQGWTTNGTAEVSAYTPISSSGTLFAGVPVSQVTQTFSANVLTPGSYNITAINNGVTYKARGTFTGIGTQNFDLTASGTPVSTGTYTFTSNTTPRATFDRTTIHLSTNGIAVVSSYTPISSSGTLFAGVAVSEVTQTITADVTTIGTFAISTSTVNGVRFAASGTFTNTGSQNITLTAIGTPITTGTFTFTSNTTPSITFTIKIISITTNGTAVISRFNRYDINGGLFIGVPIDEGSVFQRITVNTSVAGDYNIATQPINGVTFSGSGNLTVGDNKTIDLFASGTPTNAGAYNYTTNTSSPNISFWIDVIHPSTNGNGVVSSYALKSSSGTLYRGAYEYGENKEIITANVTSPGSSNTYNITTNTANGITFQGSGALVSGNNRDIILTAIGTPIAEGTFTYTINTNPSVTFTRTTAYSHPSSNGTAEIASITGLQDYANGNIYSGDPIATNDFDKKILLTVNLNKGGTFNLSSSANGITFRSRGTLPNGGPHQIVHVAQGTPIIAGTNTFDLNISGVSGLISHNTSTNVHPSSKGNGHITSVNSYSSAGTMTRGIPVSGVTQTFNVNVSRLGSYNISTGTVDGVTFAGSGIFTYDGNQDIVLTATGTPTSSIGSKSFTINVNPIGDKTFIRTVNEPDVSTNGSAIVSGYSSSSSAGTMTVGVPVSGVTQTYIANVTTAGSYSITTATVQGVSFAASGTFTETGNQQVTLIASGTPTVIGTYSYTSNTNPIVSFTRTAVINPSSNGTANILSITPTTSAGTMFLSDPVSGVTQNFNLNVGTAGSYSITTTTANGVTFAGSSNTGGTGNRTITLTATGTPIQTGSFTYAINTNHSISFTRSTVLQPSTNGSAIVTVYNFGNPTIGRLMVGRSSSVSGQITHILATVTKAGTYSITTTPNRGITYAGSGTITTTGSINIPLIASGTPTEIIAAASNAYQLNTNPFMNTPGFTRQIFTNAVNSSSNGTAAITYNSIGTSVGTMTVGVPVSGVTQTINVNVTQTGNYMINTNPVNGVVFSTGANLLTFTTTGPQTITLTAYGIPKAAGTNSFTIDSNQGISFNITTNQ
jgi:uncharacterized protein (TIGR02145 family)